VVAAFMFAATIVSLVLWYTDTLPMLLKTSATPACERMTGTLVKEVSDVGGRGVRRLVSQPEVAGSSTRLQVTSQRHDLVMSHHMRIVPHGSSALLLVTFHGVCDDDDDVSSDCGGNGPSINQISD